MIGTIRTNVLVFAVFNIALAVQAGAQTTGCERLSAADLPYIDTAGVYCLTEDVTVNLGSGAAIQILVNDVVLDLGGHLVRNSAHDPGDSVGIHAYDLQRVTVRNGRIQGFERGVSISTIHGASRGPVLVEDLQVSRAAYVGIKVTGSVGIIRRNTVHGIGNLGRPNCYGIIAGNGSFRVVDNDVHEVSSPDYSFGISFTGSENTIVAGNRVSSVDWGIGAQSSVTAICRDNVTIDVTYVPIQNCLDGGGNG